MAAKKKAPKRAKNPTQPYVIVRATGAGVHAGYLVKRDGDAVTLRDSRRLWRWVVAKQTGQLASLSEVATYGLNTSDPRSRISVVTAENTILGACEILGATDAARATIETAP